MPSEAVTGNLCCYSHVLNLSGSLDLLIFFSHSLGLLHRLYYIPSRVQGGIETISLALYKTVLNAWNDLTLNLEARLPWDFIQSSGLPGTEGQPCPSGYVVWVSQHLEMWHCCYCWLAMKTCWTSRPIPDFSTGLRVAPSTAVIRRFMPIIIQAVVVVHAVGISCQFG